MWERSNLKWDCCLAEWGAEFGKSTVSSCFVLQNMHFFKNFLECLSMLNYAVEVRNWQLLRKQMSKTGVTISNLVSYHLTWWRGPLQAWHEWVLLEFNLIFILQCIEINCLFVTTPVYIFFQKLIYTFFSSSLIDTSLINYLS